MEHGLLEQGRLLKDSAGDMFYDPAALVAFCRFNFSLRRAFIRMLHADLNAVKTAVDILEAAGVKSVDCRRAGFSAAENYGEASILLRELAAAVPQGLHRKLRQPRIRAAIGSSR